MKSLNLTNVIITLVLFTVGWLFVPSPFYKCPKVEKIIVIDTFYLEPDKIVDIGPLSLTSDEVHEVGYEHIEIVSKDSAQDVYVIDLLTFEKESVIEIPEDTTQITQGKDTLGIVILGATNGRFRSTTFYQMGDSLAQTIHEIVINVRPMDVKLRPIEVEFEVSPRPLPEKPISILESPVTWGLLGIIAGAIVTGLIISNKKD